MKKINFENKMKHKSAFTHSRAPRQINDHLR